MNKASGTYIESIATQYADIDGDYDWTTFINVKLNENAHEEIRQKVLNTKQVDINEYPELVIYVEVCSTTPVGQIQLWANSEDMEPLATVDLLLCVLFQVKAD